mgnify:CR=1 FL=1
MYTVTVYSKPQCVQCSMSYKALEKHGVQYVVVDITESPAPLEFITQDLGY